MKALLWSMGIVSTAVAVWAYLTSSDVMVAIGIGVGTAYVIYRAWREANPPLTEVICPHCASKGTVTAQRVVRKKGVSGGKATGAVLTGGASMLATGLSRKQTVTEMNCTHCHTTWDVE